MALPRPVSSFLHSVAISPDAVIYPFCTHDGYGCNSATETVRASFKRQVSNELLEVPSSSISASKDYVEGWRPVKSVQESVNKIQLKVGGKSIQIELNDSPEARQFKKMLPLTVRMGEFGSREYYGPLDGEIKTTSNGQYHFEDGTLTYCPTNNTVAIFYSQSSRPNLTMAVYPMGKVISDLEIFHKLGHYEKFEFSALP